MEIASSRHARFAHLDVAFTASLPVREPDLLFLPFQEGDERMGLPLSYRIVKNMGGALTFSQIGNEAAFTVQLPLGPLGEPVPTFEDDAEEEDAGDETAALPGPGQAS